MARVCLITPSHVAFQPRTIREADTLTAAGHDVRVVAVQRDAELVGADHRLLQARRWRLQALDLRREGASKGAWLTNSLESRAYRFLFDSGLRNESIAARAYLRGFRTLLRLAAQEQADWFIAHTQPALAVAVAAARRWSARVGFDCEDLLEDSGTDPADLVHAVEAAHLRSCAYVSASSKAIASVLGTRHGVAAPLVLYNVFPLCLADGLAVPRERPRSRRLRLHWFGQTIGPGRGLEDAIDAAGRLDESVEIHLRGRVSEQYASALRSRASQQRTAPTLSIDTVLDHDRLVRAVGAYDVGLSLEQGCNLNAASAATNKLFSYLTAGLAIAVTATPGQREILDVVPQAGFSYPPGDVDALAAGLKRWQASPEELCAAQTAAWEAARARFCWDREQAAYLGALGLG